MSAILEVLIVHSDQSLGSHTRHRATHGGRGHRSSLLGETLEGATEGEHVFHVIVVRQVVGIEVTVVKG